jgi:transcriptional regulator with XRE-family HTH domain
MEQVADILKQFRLERDWTFERLSVYTGVNVATLCRVERKQNVPNARTLYKLRKSIPAIDLALEERERQVHA